MTEAQARGAAFFDLDRTIITGSSMFALGWAAYRAGMVPNRDLVDDVVNVMSFIVSGAGDEKTEAVKKRVLKAIGGVSVGGTTFADYDVAPDGRFVMFPSAGEEAPNIQLARVVVNWFEELQRLVPRR